ncbi:unnamed protein product [Amaranthus hypochondriacus]
MVVCYTCGVEGFPALLIYCQQCNIVAVHRYCVDGRPIVDEDEAVWSCEECVPRKLKSTLVSRKSERINLQANREALRKKARKNWKQNSISLKVVQSKCAGNIDKRAGDEKSDLDENKLYSEECAPRKPEPTLVSRKSERINIQANHLGSTAILAGDEKANLDENTSSSVEKKAKRAAVRKRANNASNWDEGKDETGTRYQGKLKENEITQYTLCTTVVGSEPAPLIRKKRTAFNSDDASNKKSSEPSLLTGHKTDNLNSCMVNDDEKLQKKLANVDEHSHPEIDNVVENLQTKLVNVDDQNLRTRLKTVDDQSFKTKPENVDEIMQIFDDVNSQNKLENGHDDLQKKPEMTLSRQQITKEPEISLEIMSNTDDIEQSLSDINSNVQDKQEENRSFPVVEEPNSSGLRKRRRLIIAMDFYDSDEEPVLAQDKDLQIRAEVGGSIPLLSTREPPVMVGENVSADQSFKKFEGRFPTQLYPINSDNIQTQASSQYFYNCFLNKRAPPLFTNYIPAQPINNAVWRGHCSVRNEAHLSIRNYVCPISFGMEARLSTKAHGNVHGAASALPNLLSFEIVEKRYVWPDRFRWSSPTGDSIGLYFFPVKERDEECYDYLLEKMIECDLVLKCHILDLELLAFCSHELPREERRFQSKYYLWAVFKRRQGASLTSGDSDFEISSTVHEGNSLIRDAAKAGVQPSKRNNDQTSWKSYKSHTNSYGSRGHKHTRHERDSNANASKRRDEYRHKDWKKSHYKRSSHSRRYK